MLVIAFGANPRHLQLEFFLLCILVHEIDSEWPSLVAKRNCDKTTHILAASITASGKDSSANLSFSNSVFANWRPLPTAAPLYP